MVEHIIQINREIILLVILSLQRLAYFYLWGAVRYYENKTLKPFFPLSNLISLFPTTQGKTRYN
jgi:hypothetical protein